MAATVMAIEGVHRIPVTSESGEVVGILSALDVLRWLAEQDGYAIERPPRHDPHAHIPH
jgi:CBS domain-containing protein